MKYFIAFALSTQIKSPRGRYIKAWVPGLKKPKFSVHPSESWDPVSQISKFNVTVFIA